MHLRKPVLYLIAFLSGAVVLALEILAGRFLQPSFGFTHKVWGVLIGIFLAGLAIGYYVGGHVADMLARFWLFGLLLLLSAALLLALPMYATDVRDAVFEKLDLDSVETLGPLETSIKLFLLPTIIFGMITPYAVRLLADDPDRLGRQVGTLYAVSTLGSIVGALGTSFKLVDWFGTRDAFLVLGSTQLVLAVIAFAYAVFAPKSR